MAKPSRSSSDRPGSEAQSRRDDADTDRRFQLGYEACEKVLSELDPRDGQPA